MTPTALLEAVRARGVEVRTDGQQIGIRPAGVLTPEEREALLNYKPEILAILQASSPAQPPPAPAPQAEPDPVPTACADEEASSPSPDTLRILLGLPLEVNPKAGKAKGGIDPPAAAWELIWTLRGAGVRLGVDPEHPNYINVRPGSLVSAAQRDALERLSYDVWWLLGESAAVPGDLVKPVPWPDEILGLGPRQVGLFRPCRRCGKGSWVAYGSIVYCLPHAQAAERDGQALAAEVRRQQREGGQT